MGRRGTRLGREMYREPGRLAGLDVEAERTFAAPVERDQGELVVPGLELEVRLWRGGAPMQSAHSLAAPAPVRRAVIGAPCGCSGSRCPGPPRASPLRKLASDSRPQSRS